MSKSEVVPDRVLGRWAGYLDGARQIAADVLAPQAEAIDRAGALPADNIRRLAEAGLLGLVVPQKYGGLGAPGTGLNSTPAFGVHS